MFGIGPHELLLILLVCCMFLALGSLAFWSLRRALRPQSKSAPPLSPKDADPLTILATRYARGEIDTTEFNERQRQLQQATAGRRP